MMHTFLANNRDELIARCKAKVAKRPNRRATMVQLQNGIPLFLDQLKRTLEAEELGQAGQSLKISGPSGGDASALSEMGVSAAAHGKELLALGLSVDQVVHDYGDLCQAITDLAHERDAPFAVTEFRTLNRCLDNAIADAVTEFSFQRDSALFKKQSDDANERRGFLMHEMRNCLGGATLAVAALEAGNLPVAGATGSVLKRSLASAAAIIAESLDEVRTAHAEGQQPQRFSLAAFIAEAKDAAVLYSNARGGGFTVSAVDPELALEADRARLLAALTNLLQNAFKFTHHQTSVTLNAYAQGDRIVIDVKDQCGGLKAGDVEGIFAPFSQRNENRTGLGLGLPIARQSVEADNGSLTVRDVPGTGCVFTITLPRHSLR